MADPLTARRAENQPASPERPRESPHAQRATNMRAPAMPGLNSLASTFSLPSWHFPANVATICRYPGNAAAEKTAWRGDSHSNLQYHFWLCCLSARQRGFEPWSVISCGRFADFGWLYR